MKPNRSWIPFLLLWAVLVNFPAHSARAAFATYNGLITGDNLAPEQSGYFVIDVDADGSFSGQIVIGPRRGPLHGEFDAQGHADVVVIIKTEWTCWACDPVITEIQKKAIWNASLQLINGGNQIIGSVHFRLDDLPDSTLFGKRSTFNRGNPSSNAGNYTFALLGTGDPTDTSFPTGDGIGTIKIDSFGTVRLGGTLADGSTLSPGSVLCDDGTCPVFAMLYNNKGMIQGWLQFTNEIATDLNGDLIWVKPGDATPAFYPAGFTNDVPAIGSRYVSLNPALNFSDGTVAFQGGNVDPAFTNSVTLNSNNSIANFSANKLSLKITTSSGLFKGSVAEPVTGRTIPFKGVVLQKSNQGLGFFLDAPRSGEVLFEAAP